MKTMYLKYFIIFSLSFTGRLNSFSQQQWSSRYVTLDKNGTLHYIPDEKGNIIPDFSKVGYYAQARQVPFIPVVKIVEPSDSNSQQIIQAAIDEVSQLPVDK